MERGGVGEGAGAGSAQSSLVGVERVETGPDKYGEREEGVDSMPETRGHGSAQSPEAL